MVESDGRPSPVHTRRGRSAAEFLTTSSAAPQERGLSVRGGEALHEREDWCVHNPGTPLQHRHVSGDPERETFQVGGRKRFRGRIRTGLLIGVNAAMLDNDDRSDSAGNHAGTTFAESNDARSHEVGQPVDLWAR